MNENPYEFEDKRNALDPEYPKKVKDFKKMCWLILGTFGLCIILTIILKLWPLI